MPVLLFEFELLLKDGNIETVILQVLCLYFACIPYIQTQMGVFHVPKDED